MHKNHHLSDLDDAKYAVVHDHPGGSRSLAKLVGMNSGTLSNKVNADVETHHLTVDEAVAIQHATNDRRIIEIEARILGGCFVRLDDFTFVSDVELLDKYAELHAAIGKTSQSIRLALEDNKITGNELKEIRLNMNDSIKVLMELYHRLFEISDVKAR
ncbi:MAG: phage regulatory CII family protein [Gammaproteobacteria bacterium]|nr:phage regulatory CII family protein [Gammaproteobacteria bacterium]